MSDVTTIGIDLAKRVFQLCGINRGHKVVFNRTVRRAQLLAVVGEYPDALFAMEACPRNSEFVWHEIARDRKWTW